MLDFSISPYNKDNFYISETVIVYGRGSRVDSSSTAIGILNFVTVGSKAGEGHRGLLILPKGEPHQNLGKAHFCISSVSKSSYFYVHEDMTRVAPGQCWPMHGSQ